MVRRFFLWFMIAVLPFVLIGCRVLDTARAGSRPGSAFKPWAVENNAAGGLEDAEAGQASGISSSYGGEYRDTKLERMVAKIVGRLVAVSDNPRQSYQVVILNSPNINAFALPGGYVYVTRGLLALANDSAEVAAVIAHEMAHITANHGIMRVKKQQEIALSDRVAQEVLAGNQRDEVLLRGKLKLASFSREQELQADIVGIRMIAAAGYDAFASSRFLQAMEAYSRFRDISGAVDAGLDFLSNHPATPQRGMAALSVARQVSAPAVGETDRAAFLRGIDGMIFGESGSNAEFYIRGRSFIDRRTGIALTVPPGFSPRCENGVVTAPAANDTALRFDSVAQTKRQTPAEYIVSGWISGVIEGSVQSKSINGLPAASARAQSGQWQFDVLVLMDKQRIYRFLTAGKQNRQNLESVNLATANSFRVLSEAEKQGIVKPLRLHIATVGHDDTVASLAGKMQFNDRREELFRILNGLSANQSLRPNEQVKLVAQ